MTTNPQTSLAKLPLTIRFHLTDGSVHSFTQRDAAINENLWDAIDPSRLFVRQRIVIGSEHSKSVFVSAEIIRVDFLHQPFQCWELPEEKLPTPPRPNPPSLMARRAQSPPPGDLLVSFVRLQLRGARPLFAM